MPQGHTLAKIAKDHGKLLSGRQFEMTNRPAPAPSVNAAGGDLRRVRTRPGARGERIEALKAVLEKVTRDGADPGDGSTETYPTP